MSDPHPQEDARPLSQVLEDIGARQEPRLQLGELVTSFGERGFGAMLLFLGLLSVVIGWIPGSTTILAVPMLLLATQLIFRRDQPWLPQSMLKQDFDRTHYRDGVQRALKPLRLIERVSRPRLGFMSTDLSEGLIGLACVLLALILMLPLVGFNLVPSLLVALFGFGMTQRDGVVMLAAWLGAAGFGAFCWLAWSVVMAAVHYSLGVATSLFGG